MGYKTTTVEEHVFGVPDHGLPVVIDDFSLAMHLGISCKTLWYLVRGVRTPAGETDSLYQEGSILKRGSAGKKGKRRIIHIPDPRLKRVQRILDNKFVQPIPVGNHVRAYEKGRVPADTARMCANSGILLSMDLKNFFGNTRLSWIRDLFMSKGYSRSIASIMAQLCCCTTDEDGHKRRRFMPQGTPVSPSISNRVADLRFDRKILELSKNEGWTYLRYSDNIYMSHPDVLPRAVVDKFKTSVIKSVNEAGWKVHKVRVTPKWKRQEVLGLVVNEKANLKTEEYRSLRAIINNCKRMGFASQVSKARDLLNPKIQSEENLIAHLRGKLSYVGQVLCESKREKLLGDFEDALEAEKLRIKQQWAEEDAIDQRKGVWQC